MQLAFNVSYVSDAALSQPCPHAATPGVPRSSEDSLPQQMTMKTIVAPNVSPVVEGANPISTMTQSASFIHVRVVVSRPLCSVP